ncbi:MBL fold metallo-hydrolase [Chloroflexota bacterium]
MQTERNENMNRERNSGGRKIRRGLITSAKEKLDGVNVDLTSLFCHHGANVYILTYENNGVRRHTFIDAGDLRYQNRILSVLAENDIEPANIDRIIITHGHPDHYGLAYLLDSIIELVTQSMV